MHTIMKKIMSFLFAALLLLTASCSDMLETESTRQSFDPNMDSKTDSVTYAFGILKGMQQLADQYFFIGEMRGDLVSTTLHTDNNLRQLADFTADCSNKYDSAYVYYTVINNCNYYLNHRDTTLYTGSQNMVINEYVAIAALRAWTYLQLTKTYERVPYFTEVVKEISQIDNNNYPELNTAQVVDSLAPQLLELINRYDENYLKVPDFSKNGNTALSMGSTNFGVAKYVNPEHLFVPIRVVLGDMYLETGKYEEAAKQYFSEYIGEGREVCFILGGQKQALNIGGLTIGQLIEKCDLFCTEYLASHGGTVDYIHGDDECISMASDACCAGILLPKMEKSELFTSVYESGPFPKKSFSIGHGPDKRYYLECRAIKSCHVE